MVVTTKELGIDNYNWYMVGFGFLGNSSTVSETGDSGGGRPEEQSGHEIEQPQSNYFIVH